MSLHTARVRVQTAIFNLAQVELEKHIDDVTQKTTALEKLADIDITTQTGVTLYQLHLASVVVTLDELKQTLVNAVQSCKDAKERLVEMN